MASKWLFSGFIMAALACASSSRTPSNSDPLSTYNPDVGTPSATNAPQVRNFESIYVQMGLANSGPPISFVSNVAFFASPSPDTTFATISISLPNRGLAFVKTGDEYIAEYEVTIVVNRDDTQVSRVVSKEPVRVPTFKETTRTDESIVYQHNFPLPPGRYTVSYFVRDLQGESVREGSARAFLVVPQFKPGMVSRPVVVYEATPRTKLSDPPSYLGSPRSASVFGVDSAIAVYVESYGKTAAIDLTLRSDKGTFTAWRDTVQLDSCGALFCSTIDIPLNRADIGIFHLVAREIGSADSTVTPVFIGFGSDLPVVSFEDMVSYLRFFVASSRLRALRDAPIAERGTAWTNFVRERGGLESQALQEYFVRIRDANVQFRSESVMPGWLSDRGSTFVALGQPDNVYEQNPSNLRLQGRIRWQIWEYQRWQVRLYFYDEYNAGQWKFEPESAMQFRSLLARVVGTQ